MNNSWDEGQVLDLSGQPVDDLGQDRLPKKILAVSVSPDRFLQLRSMLESSSVTQLQVTGANSMDKLSQRLSEESCDALVIDVPLPGLEDNASMEALCDSTGTPIIAVSNHDDAAALGMIQAGVQDCLRWTGLDAERLVRSVLLGMERHHRLRLLAYARRRERFLATHDSLTGLPGRPLFHEALSEAVQYAKRYEKTLGVLYIGLDDFGVINDVRGHAMGDKLLRRVGSRIHSCLRASDTVARIGGDEFVCLIRSLARASDAGIVAEKILGAMKSPFVVDGRNLSCGASVGISIFPENGTNAETLLRNADSAMTVAKDKGGQTFQFFTPELNAAARLRRGIQQRLREALDKNQLILHFQPQIDVERNRVLGFEALIRWEHPELGLVPPNLFIPLAEESGSIHQIGEWVLRTACQQLASWRAMGHPDLRVSVNLSVRQLGQPELAQRVQAVLEESCIPGELLELELTESAIMKDAKHCQDVLNELRGLGIRLAIDDFGTGHSSLSYLNRFPCDALKIDRGFVRNLTEVANSTSIIRAVVSMAHSMDLDIVAEGVETPEQLQILRDLGCELMQGYLFARPLPLDQVERFLDNPEITRHTKPRLEPVTAE